MLKLIKKAEAMLISDRVDFKARKVIRNKEEHYIMIERVSSPGIHNFLCECLKTVKL